MEGQAREESTGQYQYQSRAANRRAGAESRDLPLDAVGVSQVVSLRALLVVEEDDHGGDEVDDLAGGQQVDVGPAVFAPVAVPDIRQSRKHLLNTASNLLLLLQPHWSDSSPTAAVQGYTHSSLSRSAGSSVRTSS